MSVADAVQLAGVVTVIAPSALLLALGLPALLGIRSSEETISRLTQASVLIGLVAALVCLVHMLATGNRHVPLEVGDWVVLHETDFHFHLKFIYDRLSVPFLLLSYVLVGTIGAFANRYLHRDPGYGRFFLLFAVFLQGMVWASLAGTIETLFVGWEFVGLSSALLVAYFEDRPNPVRNGQRVWSVYRLADAAFLVAAVALHHAVGHGDFDAMLGSTSWPEGRSLLEGSENLWIGLLLLVAAAGKSALVPFSGWLPRAMEGPTPSSAVFYGALSVHLGCFLLLRVSPLIEASPTLAAAVVGAGLATALFATAVGSAQTDIKGALAFASLTQVGLITAEIGFGLRYVALVHMLGHATQRTLQLLRAPSILHDFQAMENAVGGALGPGPGRWTSRLPLGVQARLYQLALDRGAMDNGIEAWVVRPFLALFRGAVALEARVTARLRGAPAPPPDGDAGQGEGGR